MIVRVFFGRTFIHINESYHEVDAFDVDNISSLVNGMGYIMGDHVYIYTEYVPPEKPVSKGFFTLRKGNLEIGVIDEEEESSISKAHSIDNIKELDTRQIFETVKENESYFASERDIEIISNNADIFAPTIEPEDDFLKKTIKKVILSKKVNLRNYRDRGKSQYDLNNMKSGLIGKTKMTVPYFLKWVEILGLDWELKVWDNGTDDISPLDEIIIIDGQSSEDTEI